jgi:hypothetical protein
VIYIAPVFFWSDKMDIFDHIGETRDEVMAVPFYGWIRNPVECMIRYAMIGGKYSKWMQKYDIFKIMPVNDPIQLFNITMQYTIDSFFKAMVKCGTANNIEKPEIEKDFNELIMLSDPKYASITVMDVVFNKLLTEPFMKKLYIYSPVMSDSIKKTIMNIFPAYNDKIFLIEGSIRNIIEYNEDTFTTIFIEDTDLFMNVLQSYDKEEMKKYMSKKYFILPAKSSLTDSAKQIVQTMHVLPETNQFKYKDFINGNLGEVGSYADFLQLKIINWRNSE